MTQDQALMPQLITQNGNRVWQNILSVAVGVAFISLLAQIAIPLPFTPVPITGQTFGVALTALLWGRRRGVATVLTYMTLGGLGLPIFASGHSGLAMGPTLGYLVGMLIASYVMGSLADRGWTNKFYKTWFAAFCGSVITFSCGLAVLSFFIPHSLLLTSGLFPFMPGDVVKTLLASSIAWKINKMVLDQHTK